VSAEDPTELSHWRPLQRLLDGMDAEIARLYETNAIPGLRPSHVREILRLSARGPMTIGELAESFGATHSATSQKVAAMRADGWVRTAPGADARSKRVLLSAKAKRIVGRLAAEWRATESAVAEIEAEVPYALSRVVDDIEKALARKSFHDRIAARLQVDDSWR